jgi:hypothetical protein
MGTTALGTVLCLGSTAGCSGGGTSAADAAVDAAAMPEATPEAQPDSTKPEAAPNGGQDAAQEADVTDAADATDTAVEAEAGIDAGLSGKLVYASGSTPQNVDYAQIYTYSLPGGAPVAITKTIFTAVSQAYPRWSEKGTRVFYQQLNNAAQDTDTLMESAADGSGAVAIGPCGAIHVFCMDPVRTPDGTVLFVPDGGYGTEIDAFVPGRPDGGAAAARITVPTGCGISSLSLTPDGTQLSTAVFGADTRCPIASIGVYVLPSNATALTTPLPLTDTTWRTTFGFAQFNTAGTRVYYVAVDGTLRSCALDGSDAKTEVPAPVFHAAGNGETGLSRDELSVSDDGALFVDSPRGNLVFYPFGAMMPVTVVAGLGPSGIAWSP